MSAGEQPGIGRRVDPYRNFNFKLIIKGVTEGHFSRLENLGVSVESISYREGGESQLVRKLPGRAEYGDVTLKYGLTASRELFDWAMASAQGRVERRTVEIACLDIDGKTELTRWSLTDAWPCQWRGAPLDAMGNEVAFESLTLTCEALDRTDTAAPAAASPEIG